MRKHYYLIVKFLSSSSFIICLFLFFFRFFLFCSWCLFCFQFFFKFFFLCFKTLYIYLDLPFCVWYDIMMNVKLNHCVSIVLMMATFHTNITLVIIQFFSFFVCLFLNSLILLYGDSFFSVVLFCFKPPPPPPLPMMMMIWLIKYGLLFSHLIHNLHICIQCYKLHTHTHMHK